MFKVKNILYEVLQKRMSIDDAMHKLNKSETEMLVKAMKIVKSKMSGGYDILKTDSNGQWSMSTKSILEQGFKDKSKKDPKGLLKEDFGMGSTVNSAPGSSIGNITGGAMDSTSAKAEDEENKKSEIDEIKSKYIPPKQLSMKDKIKQIKLQAQAKDQAQAEAPAIANTIATKPKH